VTTVLVTGGCGFIGSHFIRALLRRGDHRVVNLDKLTYAGDPGRLTDVAGSPHYAFVQGDITDAGVVAEVIEAHRPWAVVNFAAESHVDRSLLDPGPFLHTNVLGVEVLLRLARRAGVERFLHISTDEVYGDAEGGDAATETSPLRPSSPYAASKAAADLLCLSYYRTWGTPVVVARSSNNYGPYQFPEKLIPLVILNALSGRELPLYGDGLQRRDWLYVEDNCEALLLVLDRGAPGGVYNIGTGEERTNLDVVRAICALVARRTGRDVDGLYARIRPVADRPGHDRRYALNTARVRGELGWAPRTTFEEGLERTVAWYLANQAWLARVTGSDFAAYYHTVYERRWGLGR
jgi:dTDP-glucose 4,6-dehydratase